MILGIGLITSILSTISFLPQAIYVIRTHDTKSLSLAMYLLINIAFILWLIYGILLRQAPIYLANGICLILGLIILFYKVKEIRK